MVKQTKFNPYVQRAMSGKSNANSKSGIRGVHFDANSKRWAGSVSRTVDGVRRTARTTHATKEAAVAWVEKTRAEMYDLDSVIAQSVSIAEYDAYAEAHRLPFNRGAIKHTPHMIISDELNSFFHHNSPPQ